jgi:hypothetical protein
MPTVLRLKGFRFFFYSNEGNEPIHVHVEKGDATAKYWIEPVEQAYSYDFTKAEEKSMLEIIIENQEFLKKKWYEHFGNS